MALRLRTSVLICTCGWAWTVPIMRASAGRRSFVPVMRKPLSSSV